MHERLSFYIHRDSLLHRANPLTKLVLAFALIINSYASPFYWTPTLLILGVIFPLSFLGKVSREFLSAILRLLIPVAGLLFIMQSLFLPYGGETVFRFCFLDATTESVGAGYQTATRIFVMVSAFILLLLTTHPSELMSDLTRRGLPGQLAYVVVSTLQILPQMQAKAMAIVAAQRSRGLETEGSLLTRIRALTPLVGPLVFGSLVEVEERAIALEARAFMSSSPKTSLREIPDSRADQFIRWGLCLATLTVFAVKLWQS